MNLLRIAIAILALSCVGQASGFTFWEIKVRDGDASCDLIGYSAEGVDDLYTFFAVGFYFLSETRSVPGHQLPKGESVLLVRAAPGFRKSSSYVKPEAVEVNGNVMSTYQWDEGSESDPVFYFISGPTAKSLFEAARHQNTLTVTLIFEGSDDRTIVFSTDRESSFPVLAEMLVTCGQTILESPR